MLAALVAGGEDARDRLEAAVRSATELIPLSSEIVLSAQLHELLYSLSPQDALVLESVRWHAVRQDGPKCFITQDAKGFANPSVYDELGSVKCKVIVNFADGVEYIKHASEGPAG